MRWTAIAKVALVEQYADREGLGTGADLQPHPPEADKLAQQRQGGHQRWPSTGICPRARGKRCCWSFAPVPCRRWWLHRRGGPRPRYQRPQPCRINLEFPISRRITCTASGAPAAPATRGSPSRCSAPKTHPAGEGGGGARHPIAPAVVPGLRAGSHRFDPEPRPAAKGARSRRPSRPSPATRAAGAASPDMEDLAGSPKARVLPPRAGPGRNPAPPTLSCSLPLIPLTRPPQSLATLCYKRGSKGTLSPQSRREIKAWHKEDIMKPASLVWALP